MSTRVKIPKASNTIMVQEAIDAILVYFSTMEAPINHADLLDRSRDAYTLKVRAVVMWFLKTEAHLSYPVIGKMFDRDHTSVINLCRRVHDLVETDDLTEIVTYAKTRVERGMRQRHEAMMAEVGA